MNSNEKIVEYEEVKYKITLKDYGYSSKQLFVNGHSSSKKLKL